MGAILLLAATLAAPQQGRTIVVDDFEGELSGWAAFRLDTGGIADDADARVALAREAGDIRQGRGALSYAYDVAPADLRVLALQRPLDLTGMKSMRLWVKSSHATAVIIGLSERSGATYQVSAYCAADTWQEIGVNLDEFLPDEPGKDANGKLDLDDIGSIHVLDVASHLVNLLPELQGRRVLRLDDVSFSADAVESTVGPASMTRVVPIFVVDTFESRVIRWVPVSLEFADVPRFSAFDAPVAIDATAPPGGGTQSLKFTYPRRATKVHALLRNLEKNDLRRATGLELSLRTQVDGTFVVAVEEQDGSRYQKLVELREADGWKAFSIPLSELTLADDSQDENGRLDPDQIKQISLADVTSVFGGGEGENSLWIDQVRFILSP